MAEQLAVKVRKEQGKNQVKKLRREGLIPAVLYGHGEAAVNLALTAEAVSLALRHGSKFVNLTGDVNESALIRDLQWDTYGLEVLHVDFARVSQDERIHVKVACDLKGTAAGQKEGGIVQHLVHELEIECLATAIPDKLHINITNLVLDGHIAAGEIPLPEGIKLLAPKADVIVVSCVKPTEEVEGVALPGAEGAEPELIRKPKEEEGDEE